MHKYNAECWLYEVSLKRNHLKPNIKLGKFCMHQEACYVVTKCSFPLHFREEGVWFTKLSRSTSLPPKILQEAKDGWHFSVQTWVGMMIVGDSQESICQLLLPLHQPS